MGYNYFAYEVLHGVQVMQPNYTVPVSNQRKRESLFGTKWTDRSKVELVVKKEI